MATFRLLLAGMAISAFLAGSAAAQQSPPPGDVPPATQPTPDPRDMRGEDRDQRGPPERGYHRGDQGEERSEGWARRPHGGGVFDRDERDRFDRGRMGDRGRTGDRDGMMGRRPYGGGDERGERERLGRGQMDQREGMMRRPPAMNGACGPQSVGYGRVMIERLERATRPTPEQQGTLDQLKQAASKAAEIVRSGCAAEPAITAPGRLAAAEKRLTAMLEAIRTVRPALDAYYNSLSDEQKARLYLSQRPMMDRFGGRGEDSRGWRRGGMDNREPDARRPGWGGRDRDAGPRGNPMQNERSSDDDDEGMPERL